MRGLVKRLFTMNLSFEKRQVQVKFIEPTIKELLIFQEHLENQEYFIGINKIVPELKENDFLSNRDGIIQGVLNLIHGASGKKKEEEGQEGFLPSSIDLMSNRYGTNPIELMETMTFYQLSLFMKGYEWNLNAQKEDEKANIRILLEMNPLSDEETKEMLEKAKEDRELFKKMGFAPKNIVKSI